MEDFRIQNRKQSIPEYVASKERCIAILDAIENMPDNWQKVANLKLIQGRPTEGGMPDPEYFRKGLLLQSEPYQKVYGNPSRK